MPADAPPLVFLHGFTQTGISWRPVVDQLTPLISDETVVHAFDLPGHGEATEIHADLAAGADGVARQIRETGEPAVVIGYSMGGRHALRLALDHPDEVAGLVLLGSTAGIDDPADRAARRVHDGELADRIEADGVLPFLDSWLAQPLFADLEPASDDLAARRANSPTGLAASLRLAGTGTMDPPWWDEIGAIDVPTLVVSGEQDAKFAAIGERLATAIGTNARTAVIPGAGHAAHLEHPDEFAQLVVALIDELCGR